MKAISLWQPWASLMVIGAKSNETRSWGTSHRGELAICSAKKRLPVSELPAEALDVLWQNRSELFSAEFASPMELYASLPFGRILCVVYLYDVRMTEYGRDGFSPVELACGDYSPGRFVWKTGNLQCLTAPIPIIGRQSIFNLPADVEVRVREQLR